MLLWGLYYDLITFGVHDFIAKEVRHDQHASGHAFIGIFKTLGYIIGPILAGFMIASNVPMSSPYVITLFFVFGAIFLLVNVIDSKKHKKISVMTDGYVVDDPFEMKSFWSEIKAWFYVWRRLKSVLIFVTLLFAVDATFWIIAPLLSEEFANFPSFGGMFLALSVTPPLFISLFVGRVTGKFGKKRVAFVSFAIASLFFSSIGFIHNPYIILGVVFLGSTVSAFAFPSIQGAIADYLSESRRHDNEILGVYDFSTNIGYVIGPIFAGIMADLIGNFMTFSLVAIIAFFVSVVLLIVTPRSIEIETRSGREFRY